MFVFTNSLNLYFCYYFSVKKNFSPKKFNSNMNAGNQIPNLDKILRDDDESDFFPAAGYVFTNY